MKSQYRTFILMVLAVISIGLLTAAPATAATSGDELPVQSVISSVMIFPDRATISREASLNLEHGQVSIVLGGLPASLIPDSIRASGKGTASVKILGLEVAAEYFDASLLPEVKKLEAEVAAQEVETARISDRMAVLDAQEKFLGSMDAGTASGTSAAVAPARPDIASLEKLVDFLGTRLQTIKTSRLDLQGRFKAEKLKLEALKNKLDSLRPKNPREARKVTVLLDVATAGSFKLELDYTVGNARWYPLYTLRAIPETGKVDFSYAGVIVQRTGENWDGVKAVLSTASPASAASPSSLDPWYLDVYVPRPVVAMRQSKSMLVEEKSVGGVVAEAAPESADAVAAEYATAAVAESGLNLNFEIRTMVVVPCDGAPHRVPVDGQSLDASFDYLAVPKTGEAAYLRGKVKNSLPYPLLPGQADIFILQDFVGSTNIENTPAGEELELFFGADRQVKVTHEELKRDKSQSGLIGKTEKVHYAYRITIENLRQKEISLELKDQIPVSRNEKIGIKDVTLTPAPSTREEQGVLGWSIKLAPGEKKQYMLEFTVEYPKGTRITGI